MFGKVKKILGIEGAKIELVIPETFSKLDRKILGKINIKTINPTRIESIQVRLLETYSRGRGKSRRTDVYVLGTLDLEQQIDIASNEIAEVSFELDFNLNHTAIDSFSDKNIFTSVLGRIAKYSKAVESIYELEAVAQEAGTLLHPKNKKAILISK